MKQLLILGLAMVCMVSCKKTEDAPASGTQSVDLRAQLDGRYANSEIVVEVFVDGESIGADSTMGIVDVKKHATMPDRLEFSDEEGFLCYANMLEEQGDALVFQVPYQEFTEEGEMYTSEGTKQFTVNGKQCSGYKQNGVFSMSIQLKVVDWPNTVIKYTVVLKK